MSIPIDGTPNPMALLPKGREMAFVTSHFSLPMRNPGNSTGLTQEFVESLDSMTHGMVQPKDNGPKDMGTGGGHTSPGTAVSLLLDEHFPTGPTMADLDNAGRLLRKSPLYRNVKALKQKHESLHSNKAASLYSGGSPHGTMHFNEMMDSTSIFFQAGRHYAMIEASLVTNMLNYPTLSEVYVIYDSVTSENHCPHLKARLLEKASKVLIANGFDGDTTGRVAQIKCLDRHESQPSYWEMFDLASNKLDLDSEVVVMGNGDGSTDETIGLLSAVEPGVAVMLSVTGFGADSTLTEWQTNNLLRQPTAQKVFESLIGPFTEVCDPIPKSRCLRTFEQRKSQALMTFEEGHPGEWHYFRWPEQMLSWDAYIFRRPLPPLSPKVLHPGIFMNMPGAENRAGMALYLALGKDSLIYNNTLPNACGHVNWYHYHCTGQAVQYDPTDNVAMTTHEWRSLFGNVSLPPKSALVRGMDMAIGVDHTLDLELTIRSLIVPITTGCASLSACLHGGKPTHHVLPDVINYLGYDPTCTQPECKEVTDALLPTLDPDVDTDTDPTGELSEEQGEGDVDSDIDPSPNGMKLESLHTSSSKAHDQCAAALGGLSLVSQGSCGASKKSMCSMCCSAEGKCGSDAKSCGKGHQSEFSLLGKSCWPKLKYERLEANVQCQSELFLPHCEDCKNELNVDWGFAPKGGSHYQNHLPNSDLLYASDKIMECMNRCQHHHGSEAAPIKAFALDSHGRCACAADECSKRVAVAPPSEGNALMDMTATYRVVAQDAKPKMSQTLYEHGMKSTNNKAEKVAMDAKLGANETERAKNKAILRRLEEHDKHATNLLHFDNDLSAIHVETHKPHHDKSLEVDKTISTAVTGHAIAVAAHAKGKAAPITIHAGAQFEDAMLIDHVLAANAVGLLEEKDLLYPLASDEWGNAHHFWVAQACQCNPFMIVEKISYADNWHTPVWYPMEAEELRAKYPMAKKAKHHTKLKGTKHEIALLAALAKKHVTSKSGSTDFHKTLTKLKAKASHHTDKTMAPAAYPPDSAEDAGHEDYPGNTPPYVGAGFVGSKDGEYPFGSIPKYESNAQAAAAQQQQAQAVAASPEPPIAIDPDLEFEETAPLPAQEDGIDNSDTLSIMKDGWPSVPGEDLGWPLTWRQYNWHDADALRKVADPVEYRTEAEEAAHQWSIVPENDFNGIGIKQSKDLYDALGDSLAAHTGPKLLSSFTLATVEIDALYAAKKMADMYSSAVRVVCFYRDEKTYFVNRYRYQDLFKITLDKLGPFEYPTYTMAQTVHESFNSTTKGRDGIVVNGTKVVGAPMDVETLLSKNYRNHTQGWDRLIEVFGRANFRLIDYYAVKADSDDSNSRGFDVANALAEIATAVPLPVPPLKPPSLAKGYTSLPTDLRSASYAPEYMDEREVAFRQLWSEFRGYAYTRANCTVVWPWESRKVAFSTILPMATWDIPMRCFDLTSLDAEALILDADARANYDDVLLFADEAATKKAIRAESEPFCELDVLAVRNDTERWSAFFMQQLMALPYGSCAEGRETKGFLPPPMYKTAPPSPPCDTVVPITEMDPSDWVSLPPPLPPPPPSPPPLNAEFTSMFTEATESDRAFSCASRAKDKPFTKFGVPSQYVHVPKAAGSSIQMLLAYYIAIPQDIFFIVGDVQDYPVNPPGTLFAGHSPMVNSPDSKYQAKRDFYARNPLFMSTIREPLARMISLYDYRALFNMTMCEGEPNDMGFHTRAAFLDIVFPGPSISMCEAVAQFKNDEADAIASGVAETGLMDHFYKKRHPLVLQMAKETLYGWFVPRDDPERTYPSTTESALACAMSNALRTDIIINSERYDQTVLPSLKYHAPYLQFDVEVIKVEALRENVVNGARESQILTPETIAEIQRLPTFVQDTRFYLFADKVAIAREANLMACMKLLNETDLRLLAFGNIPHYPGHHECQETCEDVLTEDEWLLIKNADCGKAPEAYPVFPGSPAGIPPWDGIYPDDWFNPYAASDNDAAAANGVNPAYAGDNAANPGHSEIPPVMMQRQRQ